MFHLLTFHSVTHELQRGPPFYILPPQKDKGAVLQFLQTQGVCYLCLGWEVAGFSLGGSGKWPCSPRVWQGISLSVPTAAIICCWVHGPWKLFLESGVATVELRWTLNFPGSLLSKKLFLLEVKESRPKSFVSDFSLWVDRSDISLKMSPYDYKSGHTVYNRREPQIPMPASWLHLAVNLLLLTAEVVQRYACPKMKP